ncbi:hypothetical protein ACQPYK_01800 [Streptosporangium sp. CA-135522]|uniref:hypothetical protein n=1 Tax=Streptosporangium sp. CA-135522 TaxID=3240072 RepID=UPI003D93D593
MTKPAALGRPLYEKLQTIVDAATSQPGAVRRVPVLEPQPVPGLTENGLIRAFAQVVRDLGVL